jgi:hypothetical protein
MCNFLLSYKHHKYESFVFSSGGESHMDGILNVHDSFLCVTMLYCINLLLSCYTLLNFNVK